MIDCVDRCLSAFADLCAYIGDNCKKITQSVGQQIIKNQIGILNTIAPVVSGADALPNCAPVYFDMVACEIVAEPNASTVHIGFHAFGGRVVGGLISCASLSAENGDPTCGSRLTDGMSVIRSVCADDTHFVVIEPPSATLQCVLVARVFIPCESYHFKMSNVSGGVAVPNGRVFQPVLPTSINFQTESCLTEWGNPLATGILTIPNTRELDPFTIVLTASPTEGGAQFPNNNNQSFYFAMDVTFAGGGVATVIGKGSFDREGFQFSEELTRQYDFSGAETISVMLASDSAHDFEWEFSLTENK